MFYVIWWNYFDRDGHTNILSCNNPKSFEIIFIFTKICQNEFIIIAELYGILLKLSPLRLHNQLVTPITGLWHSEWTCANMH